MNEVTLTFLVAPMAKQSVRGGKGQFYTDPKKRRWVNAVRSLAMEQYHGKPLEGPLWADIEFRFFTKNRKLHGKVKDTRPDRDNLLKPFCDALNGVLFVDDSQLGDGPVRKVWADECGITITVRPA